MTLSFVGAVEEPAAYHRLYHDPLQRRLDAEYRIITGLAGMTDDELNRIGGTLSGLNLAPFSFGAPCRC